MKNSEALDFPKPELGFPIAGQYDTEPDILVQQNQRADARIIAAAQKALEATTGLEDSSVNNESAA